MESIQESPIEPKKPSYCHTWKHDRGQLDENGQVLRKSSELFICELEEAVEEAYAQVFQFVFLSIQESDRSIHKTDPQPSLFDLILEDVYLSIEEATSTLLVVVPELCRLQRQQNLYPSSDSAKRFLCSIRNIISINHKRTLSAAKKMHQSLCWERIHSAEQQIILAIQHPTYDPHLNSWQQFLMDGAPGSGLNARGIFYDKKPDSLATPSGSSSFRILPPGAVCILREWHLKAREMERKCRETAIPGSLSSDPSKAYTTQEIPTMKDQIPSFGLRHEMVRFTSSPNIWFPHQPDFRSFADVAEPAQLSLMIDTLEGYDEQRLYTAPQTFGTVIRTEHAV
ncbi:hypothetical protein DTO271G3_4784 [Paecilomyces variotii]|nr:hypothetical protein DTO271G3_4784 [Paecilomyces variotii]